VTYASDIAAWPCEAGDEANLHRVRADANDDRNCLCRCFGRESRGGGPQHYDDSHFATDQLGRQPRQSVVLAVRPAVFRRHVLALDVAAFAQAPPECGHTVRERSRSTAEESDHRHRRLLRARRERPRSRRAAERR